MITWASILFALAAAAGGEPRRIVSTAPSITEILYALGLSDRVVGVTNYCQFPPQAARLPKVGTYLQPNLERILSLRPDLVIIPKSPLHSRNRYEAARLRTLEVQYDTLSDIYASISAIARAAGVPNRGAALQDEIRSKLSGIQARAPKQRPGVLFIVGRSPGSLEGLVTVGAHSYIDQIIGIAGGRNVFSDSTQSYFRISHEEVLARNPDIIIDMGDMGDARPITPEYNAAVTALWTRYPNIAAVKNRRVHAVSSQVFVVPGPRVVELAETLERLFR